MLLHVQKLLVTVIGAYGSCFMVIMNGLGHNSALPSENWLSAVVALRYKLLAMRTCVAWFAGLWAVLAGSSHAYILQGKSWPTGSVIVVQLSLGNASGRLQDGNTSFNAAVLPVIEMWNRTMQNVQVTAVMDSTAPAASGDHVNSIVFSNTIYGQAFGKYTLAVTYYTTLGPNLTESDTLFNTAQNFDSYRGPLQFPPHGYAVPDIRRVFLHELGHGLGLGHPDTGGQQVSAVMNSVTSDVETLSADDIGGAQSMYGAPAATPAPTPASGLTTSHLANISTRMNVGVDDNVLIGGFIISGAQPQKLILRAVGPSLASGGVAGAMQDPTLELHDSTGAVIAANNDWAAGPQQSEINASGVAPSNPKESAIIATLSPGSYTAIVRGSGNSAGVALVEAYELETSATRLVNISTRGQVGVGDKALIGGLIIQGGNPKSVIVRALGPSLGAGQNAIAGVLANPLLELHDSAGNLLAANDNWTGGSQSSQIISTGVAPSDPAEAALVATLSPGSYTAIVRGANNETGVALVEVFDLDQ